MRLIKVSLLLLLQTSLLTPSAVAGGWWSSIGLEGQPLGIGESIEVTVSEVMFDSLDEAEAAKEQAFFAYLVRAFDRAALEDAMTRPNPGEWWRPTSEPILAGTVELMQWDANLAKGRVALDVPDVPPGPYFLMLCDAGCDVALGDLIPSRVDITDDVLAAQTTRRLQEAEADLTLALQRSRSELRETRSSLRRAQANDAEQDRRIGKLETDLAEASKPESPPWITYAGWFSAGATAVFLFLRRRRADADRNEILIERIPDDARELINSP